MMIDSITWTNGLSGPVILSIPVVLTKKGKHRSGDGAVFEVLAVIWGDQRGLAVSFSPLFCQDIVTGGLDKCTRADSLL